MGLGPGCPQASAGRAAWGAARWRSALLPLRKPRGGGRTLRHLRKFNGKPRQAHRSIASKCQKKTISAALNSFWGLRALETSNERAIGVLSFIDVQEIIAGLHVETERKEH